MDSVTASGKPDKVYDEGEEYAGCTTDDDCPGKTGFCDSSGSAGFGLGLPRCWQRRQ